MWATESTVQWVEVCRFCLDAVAGCSWIDQLALGAWWVYVRRGTNNSETGRI